MHLACLASIAVLGTSVLGLPVDRENQPSRVPNELDQLKKADNVDPQLESQRIYDGCMEKFFAWREQGRELFRNSGRAIPEILLPEVDIKAAYDHRVELFCYEEAFELTEFPPKRIPLPEEARLEAKAKPPRQGEPVGDIPRIFRTVIDNSKSLGAKVLHAVSSVNSASSNVPGGIPSGGAGFAGYTGTLPKFALP
ncbi:MAG: hypothetical protein M1816_007951 [Peltula sp. TS41687]|nr:MAG: hypothetical protein M1816_007951 [Peltula sp. TS41687]